jgi:hypothetical protein
MHWISIACFLEQVGLDELPLEADLADRVAAEVAQLGRYNPLEAYSAALDYLSDPGRIKDPQKVQSAEEDQYAE